MGVTGAGKSSFISLLAEDGVQQPQVGHSLKSCLSPSAQLKCLELSCVGTTEPQVYSFKRPGGRRGLLTDTPGFSGAKSLHIFLCFQSLLQAVYSMLISHPSFTEWGQSQRNKLSVGNSLNAALAYV